MQKEIEAKFFITDKDTMREKFRQAGFILETPEYMMTRRAFDVPGDGRGYKWARVRQESDKVTMAIKRDSGTGINDVEEVELIVNDFDTAVDFLKAIGLEQKALQENMREVWSRGEIEATIDTWPGLTPFIEIEGPDEESIHASSDELGFDFAQAIFGGAAMMYERELGIPPETVNYLPEITFANPPKK